MEFLNENTEAVFKKIDTATIDPNVTICHCTDCQINSGTAYGVVVGVTNEEFIL